MSALPHDEEAEKGILSCFLNNPALLDDASSTVPEDSFYNVVFRIFYTFLLKLREEHKEVMDYVTICRELKASGQMEKVGGPGFVSELLNFLPTTDHYPSYKGFLHDMRVRRALITAAQKTEQEARDEKKPVLGVVGDTADRFFNITQDKGEAKRVDFKEIVAGYVETWEDRLKGNIQTGIPTRWDCFNRTFGGITPYLWLIAAYPSVGKSTALQNLEEDVLAQGKHVLHFSYESDETEIVDRLVASRAQVDSSKVFFPKDNIPNRQECQRITRAVTEVQKWGLHLRCEGTWTAEQIVAETRSMMLKHPIAMVAVDYLQLVPASEGETVAEKVTHISRTLKRGNARLRIPFVVLSQLNDDGKTLNSRAILQDAHNAICIEPPGEFVEHGKKIKSDGGWRVTKNRNGKKGDILPFRLQGEHFTWRDRTYA